MMTAFQSSKLVGCRLQQERTDTVRHPVKASESLDDLRDHRLDSGRLMDVKIPLGSVQLPRQLVETIRWPACQGHSGPGSSQSAHTSDPIPPDAKDQLTGGSFGMSLAMMLFASRIAVFRPRCSTASSIGIDRRGGTSLACRLIGLTIETLPLWRGSRPAQWVHCALARPAVGRWTIYTVRHHPAFVPAMALQPIRLDCRTGFHGRTARASSDLNIRGSPGRSLSPSPPDG